MAIYPAATGWSIKVMRDGYRFVDFVKGLDLYQKAQEIETQAIADMTRGLRPVGGQLKHGTSLTLQTAYDDTWEHVWEGETTGYLKKVTQYKTELDRYFTEMQSIYRLDRIDTKAIDGFIKWLKTREVRPNKPKTINNKLNCLSSILKRQTELGHLKGMPIIHWQKTGNNERFRFYSPWEETQILALTSKMPFYGKGNQYRSKVPNMTTNKLLHDFIVILFDTGMRPWREVHNIQASWLRYGQSGERIVRVPKEFSKTKKSRDIPIQDRALDILEGRAYGLAPNDFLFKELDYKRHAMKFWTELVRPAMSWGKDEVFYCMRHTFATRMVEYDVNLKVIQELMGHSDISQTAKYAKCTDASKLSGITKLNAGRLGLSNVHQMPDQMADNIKDIVSTIGGSEAPLQALTA